MLERVFYYILLSSTMTSPGEVVSIEETYLTSKNHMKQHVRQWRICDLMTNTAWGHSSPCAHADISTAPRKPNNVQSFAWCTIFVLTRLQEVSWRERRLVGSTYARRVRSNAVAISMMRGLKYVDRILYIRSITLTSSTVLCGNREEIYHRHTFLAAADRILQRKWFVH